MTPITIITIVVVALLTLLIFWLMWLGYSSCIRMYKLEVQSGKHDLDISKEKNKKIKTKDVLGIVGSYALLSLLVTVFVSGIVYRASGNNFVINNQTALVIKTGSMSDFYDDETASKYNYDTSLHFNVGDICVFDRVFLTDELTIGDVYGYKYKDTIITHRLIGSKNNGYIFMGDNNPISDYDFTKRLVSREDIIYHYNKSKLPGIGAFVLYAQSYFGI